MTSLKKASKVWPHTVKKVMNNLKRNRGIKVNVNAIYLNHPRSLQGILRGVEPFTCITVRENLGSHSIPFIGCNDAIQRITRVRDGRVLYENTFIPNCYSTGTEKMLYLIRKQSFGKKNALQLQNHLT